MQAGSLLAEENRTPELQSNQGRHDDQHRSERYNCDGTQDQIQCALAGRHSFLPGDCECVLRLSFRCIVNDRIDELLRVELCRARIAVKYVTVNRNDLFRASCWMK